MVKETRQMGSFHTTQLDQLRSVQPEKYPELASIPMNARYENLIGCGGLYLATQIIRQMSLQAGDVVLDLGCGLGATSLLLAQQFNVTVIAVDWWNAPHTLTASLTRQRLSHKVVPLQIDITHTIPFGDRYFDAIVSMNALFLFGSEVGFLKKLFKTLKPHGQLCVGSECFNQEPEFQENGQIPVEFSFAHAWNVWEVCFSKYHSPVWWQQVFESTGMMRTQVCHEIPEGRVFFEDMAKHYTDYFDEELRASGAMISQQRILDMIQYGKTHPVYPTVYLYSGIRSDN
jgi:SAM-dependent methyltransferase